VIIRDAAWITLYRARLPFPQVGVFLRCTGLAGEAFFTLADLARLDIEPRLRVELGPDGAMGWGASHHFGMAVIAALLATPPPCNDSAAEQQIAWMLRVVPPGGIASHPWQAVRRRTIPSREAGKACPFEGQARRPERLSHEVCFGMEF
jgi:hypothetical protein